MEVRMTENQDNLTFRQALSGKWQVPLFILAMIMFVITLFVIRPEKKEPTFQEKLDEVMTLASSNRYEEFYTQLDLLRQESKERKQLAQVYGVAADVRVQELRQNRELGVGSSVRKSARDNYQNIIDDYQLAFENGWIALDDPRMAQIYANVALAYWGLNSTESAIEMARRAIDAQGSYQPSQYRLLATMYLTAMPVDYTSLAMSLLDTMLADTEKEVDPENYSWAFVKKVELLIADGQEQKAQTLLNSAEEVVLNSQYGEMVQYLRCLAVKKAGDVDRAELMLRELLIGLVDRGDIYAQICLELGVINLEQHRYNEAQIFYNMVLDSQLGKDWYLAAMLGNAECIRKQLRYPEAISRYRDTLDLFHHSHLNRYVKGETIQKSLSDFSKELTDIGKYSDALVVLEMEQELIEKADIDAVYRFAVGHHRLADELREQYRVVSADKAEGDDGGDEWSLQQEALIEKHYRMAAEQYLRVAKIAISDNELYGSCVRQAALCYDFGGMTDKSIEVWLRFIEEWEGTAYRADALFQVAQAYQSIGDFDNAIKYYGILRDENPRSPAGIRSVVPMSRSYLAKEPPDYAGAERILQSVLNDVAIMPDSPYFYEATSELGELYYRMGNYRDAITALSNAIKRNPTHQSTGKVMFLVGDSYRQSSRTFDEKIAEIENDPIARINLENYVEARREMLVNARDYFAGAIKAYNQIPEEQRDKRDRIYLKHSWLYQADCLFDLGDYRQAVDLYEQAALRYQMTPTALMALVQVVNCHVKLNNPRAASSANSRAMSQLVRMDDKDLIDSEVSLSREQWEQWFTWADKLGIW